MVQTPTKWSFDDKGDKNNLLVFLKSKTLVYWRETRSIVPGRVGDCDTFDSGYTTLGVNERQ